MEKFDEAADAAGAAARAAIADTRARAQAAVTALRAEIDAADGTHAVTKMLGKKGSLSPSGELADALRKPPGTIAIIAEGAQIGSVSLGGFDLDDPVFLSGEFRRGNAAAPPAPPQKKQSRQCAPTIFKMHGNKQQDSKVSETSFAKQVVAVANVICY